MRHYRLEEVKRIGEKVIKTEVVGDKTHEDWERYSDPLFMAAIAESGWDKKKARGHLETGMKTRDGPRILDRVNELDRSLPPEQPGLRMVCGVERVDDQGLFY